MAGAAGYKGGDPPPGQSLYSRLIFEFSSCIFFLEILCFRAFSSARTISTPRHHGVPIDQADAVRGHGGAKRLGQVSLQGGAPPSLHQFEGHPGEGRQSMAHSGPGAMANAHAR